MLLRCPHCGTSSDYQIVGAGRTSVQCPYCRELFAFTNPATRSKLPTPIWITLGILAIVFVAMVASTVLKSEPKTKPEPPAIDADSDQSRPRMRSPEQQRQWLREQQERVREQNAKDYADMETDTPRGRELRKTEREFYESHGEQPPHHAYYP